MDYSQLARKMLEASAEYGKKYVAAQLRRDADNRYSLTEEWVLPSLRNSRGLPSGEYRGEIVSVVCDGAAILVWYAPFESTSDDPICDGASRFPDLILGINLVPGSIAHDVWYREMESIAQAFGCDMSIVRAMGDDIFKSVNLAENEGKRYVDTISTLTYWGVRLFGGIYHSRHMASAMAIVLTLVVAAGCSGCVSTEFERPEDYQSPSYEQSALAMMGQGR